MMDQIELLAQGIHMQTFGIKTLMPEWMEWAAANSVEAETLRTRARAMLDARRGHHHSLGWLDE